MNLLSSGPPPAMPQGFAAFLANIGQDGVADGKGSFARLMQAAPGEGAVNPTLAALLSAQEAPAEGQTVAPGQKDGNKGGANATGAGETMPQQAKVTAETGDAATSDNAANAVADLVAAITQAPAKQSGQPAAPSTGQGDENALPAPQAEGGQEAKSEAPVKTETPVSGNMGQHIAAGAEARSDIVALLHGKGAAQAMASEPGTAPVTPSTQAAIKTASAPAVAAQAVQAQAAAPVQAMLAAKEKGELPAAKAPSPAVMAEGSVAVEGGAEPPALVRTPNILSASSAQARPLTEAPAPVRSAPDMSASMTIVFSQAGAPASSASNLVQAAAAPTPVIERTLDLGSDDAWIEQLARDIAATKSASGDISFRLMPKHLGRLDVAMTQGDAGVSLKLDTQHESTAAIVHAAQGKLVEDLRQQGVRVAGAEVTHTPGEAGRQSQQGQGRQPAPDTAHLIETATDGAPERARSAPPADDRRGRFA